jgi:hypothetical protein
MTIRDGRFDNEDSNKGITDDKTTLYYTTQRKTRTCHRHPAQPMKLSADPFYTRSSREKRQVRAKPTLATAPLHRKNAFGDPSFSLACHVT